MTIRMQYFQRLLPLVDFALSKIWLYLIASPPYNAVLLVAKEIEQEST